MIPELDGVEDEQKFLSGFKVEMERSIKTRFSIIPKPDVSTSETVTAKKDATRGRKIVTVDIFDDEDFKLATVLDPSIKLLPFLGMFNDLRTIAIVIFNWFLSRPMII